MPNCFQLLRDGVAVPLTIVDDEMRLHFGAPADEKRYFEAWFDTVGYALATGDGFDKIRATYADCPPLPQIATWIEANFTPKSWYERKGHERSAP